MGFFKNLFNAVLDVAAGVAEGAVTLVTTGSISDAIECVADGFADAIDEFSAKVESKREEDSEEFESRQKRTKKKSMNSLKRMLMTLLKILVMRSLILKMQV